MHPLVKVLFGLSCPPTVCGLVVPIVINPVDRVFGGRLGAHVFFELLKVSSPLFTNRYPSTSISWVNFVLGVVTPGEHSPIGSVERLSLPECSHTMHAAHHSLGLSGLVTVFY